MARLLDGHRPEIDDGDATRERLGDLAHELEVLAAGEKETKAATVSVELPFEVGEDVWHGLNLIEEERARMVEEEEIGIASEGVDLRRRVEGHRLDAAKPTLEHLS